MPLDLSHYVFGNSLFNHVSTEGTTVAHWLDLFAETAGHSYAINGEYGFLRNFADREEPLSQWGFPGVESALAEGQAFGDISFDQILIVPRISFNISRRHPTTRGTLVRLLMRLPN